MEFLNNTAQLAKVKKLMDRLNLGDDPRWLAVVLFVRNLVQQLSIFTESEKAAIQQDIFKNLTGMKPTDDQYNEVLNQLDEFIARNKATQEVRHALEQEQQNANILLREMEGVFKSMRGNHQSNVDRLDEFRTKTFGAIKVCKTKSGIMGQVRTLFTDLMTEMQEEARELEAKTRRLELRANIDPLLSQLHNRRALDSHLKSTVMRMDRDNDALSFLLLDVDHFKIVNDTYGHQAGDEVLLAIADIVAHRSAKIDAFPARYGGEELSMVMEGMTMNAALLEAEAIRASVENHPFTISASTGPIPTEPLNITVSVGVAELEQGWRPPDLVKAADRALYRAKNSGRNAVSWHGQSQD